MIEQVEIHLKYAGYIEKEKNNADKLNRLENVMIPLHLITKKYNLFLLKHERN